MPVLRELISRFSFETDKKSVNNYQKTIGSMQKSALKLGSILGISIGGKALFNLGVTAKQAEEDLRIFAGTKLDDLNNSLSIMRQRLDNVQRGASNILREKTVNVLASSFLKDFGEMNNAVEIFILFLESAALKSISSGKSIQDVFAGIADAAKTGGLEGLIGLGKFDVAKKREREFVLSTIDPADPTGRIGQEQRFFEVSSIIAGNIGEQRIQASNVSRELVALKITTQKVADVTDKASEAATIAGLKTAEAIFDTVKENKEAVDKGEKTLFDATKEGILNFFGKGVERIKERRGIATQRPIEVNIPTTINVNEATDAEGVKRIFDQNNRQMIDNAKNQIIRNGDNQ